jgi:hypothetical protein
LKYGNTLHFYSLPVSDRSANTHRLRITQKADRVDTNNQVIFGMVFVAMCLMLASWPFMCPLDPWQIILPGSFMWIGSSLLIVGLGLALGGLFQLRGMGCLPVSWLRWCVSATSFTGDTWKKKSWHRSSGTITADIASQHGYESFNR